ncbi:RecQ family ATP-dependent DNA helicase [Aeromicrobium camelliae]|uniref:ATP-dependent DNA helicase RecQ n=1 Tax=Aeromicrobium camelliae TaxID=1538144 RepID=A0A3N6Z5P7_9ACTN|nr:RecQ family ATP-dependent DNA helicase [Aeromicrobium camelliae]RQN02247.1 RecQ family ATP-dependent DNA helicase [Aeromicrobium camelliae]
MPPHDTIARARGLAAEAFGWEELRGGQEDAISALAAGTDVLCVMPTAYGKSAIYQVAGMLVDGVTVVVSPLIALQADQLAGLEDAPNAPEAVAINSAQSEGRNEDAWSSLAVGESEFIFLSPEQLAKPDVVDRLREQTVSLFVVDEAHCVSAWGHDFRPDYLRLGAVIERLGHPVTLALTATGAPPVREEIVERLAMRDARIITRGFDRPNLWLGVNRHESEDRKREAVLDQVAELRKPGLVYVATRRAAEEYAEALTDRGLRAAAYHAGLRAAERRRVHEAFLDDELDVVAATSAFGMGIDKPNVRFVVHAAITESLDSYYQEAGRAGRDGEPALVELHYRQEDLGIRRFFAARHPDAELVRAIVSALEAADSPVSNAELARRLDVSPRKLSGHLGLLHDAVVVERVRTRIRLSPQFAGSPADAVERAEEQSAMRERIDESRLEMMRGYADTTGCRRQYLLRYFGESLDEPCGNCDTCDAGTAEAAEPVADDPFPVQTRVQHVEWGEGVVMSTEDDRITVFFESEGYKVLSREAIEEDDLLEQR